MFIVYSLGNKLPEMDNKEKDIEAGINTLIVFISIIFIYFVVGIEEEDEEDVPVWKGILYLAAGIKNSLINTTIMINND